MKREDILEMKARIDEAWDELKNALFQAEAQLELLDDEANNLLKAVHELSREEFDQWLKIGVRVGVELELQGSPAPPPIKVVGISNKGFVCSDGNGKEYTLGRGELHFLDKIKVKAGAVS